ncbi:FadR/GntR family transcriptional regulator [Streptomyces sp. NPDC054784]
MGAVDDARRGAAPDPLAPVLRTVRAGNGFEEALEQILQVIRLGLVPGGERLPSERELADRLGVSRVTLREVLRVLQEQGMVESRRGRYGGTFVRHAWEPGAEPVPAGPASQAGQPGQAGPADGTLRRPDTADLEDTLRFREVLEVGAAGLCAAEGLPPGGAERLRAALDATRDAALADYRRQDTLFHLALAELAGSPSLSAQYAGVRATVNGLLNRIPLLVRNLEHAQRQHTALVDAVLTGDAHTARAVAREHCAGTAALLRGFLL